jgi:hypothetical protein
MLLFNIHENMLENMCFRGSGCAIRSHKHCSYYCNKKKCEGKNCYKFFKKPEIDLEKKILKYEKTQKNKREETQKIINRITELYSIPQDIVNQLPENTFLNSDMSYISEILNNGRKSDFIKRHFLLKINTNFNGYSINERKFFIFFIFEIMIDFEKNLNVSYDKKKLREVIIQKYKEFISITDQNFVKHFQERFRDKVNY